MRDIVKIVLNENDFNKLHYYMQFFEDVSVVQKMETYYSVTETKEGKALSYNFFEREVREIIYRLLALLPDVEDSYNGRFDELVSSYYDYCNKLEAWKLEQQVKIKEILLAEPDIKGSVIAERLKLRRDFVYDVWNDIKKEIAGEQE